MAVKYESVSDLTSLYQFPLGAVMYCVVRIRTALEALGDAKAVQLADEVEQKVDRARTLQYDWEKQKRIDPMRREGAKRLDNQIDQTLSSIARVAEEFASVDVATETSRLADELGSDLFPTGVFHITSKSFAEQHLTVDELLGRLNNEYGGHVDELNLRGMVDRLEELNEEFGEVIEPASDEVDYDEVEAAKVEAEEAFHLLIARVMADYGTDMETFNRIMKPVREQTEWARRQYRRRGRVPEVDPETGEPIERQEPTGEEDGPSDQPRNDGGSSDGEPDGGSDGGSGDGGGESSGETDGDSEET